MLIEEQRPVPELTRSSLVERLQGVCDHASWEVFFDQYWQLIYHVARRAGLAEADAEDVVQETVVEVAGSIDGFERERPGSFRSWLCAITRTKIAMFYRKEYRQQRKLDVYGEAMEARNDGTQAPELEGIWNEEWHRNILQAALEQVKRQVSPRQYQIFHCHVLREWTVAEVAAQLDVSAGMVYVTKHRVNAILKKELQKFEEEG